MICLSQRVSKKIDALHKRGALVGFANLNKKDKTDLIAIATSNGDGGIEPPSQMGGTPIPTPPHQQAAQADVLARKTLLFRTASDLMIADK